MNDPDKKQSGAPRYLNGYFIVSEAELKDPNFVRTVVLMIQHDESGAFGLIVNRKTDFTLSDALSTLEDTPQGELPLYVGGPVEQYYIFTLHSGLPEEFHSPNIKQVTEGVYFEPDFQLIERYLEEEWIGLGPVSRPWLRFFIGYSGWAPDQLEGELERKAWVILPAEKEIVFHPYPDDGWTDALKRLGGIYWVVAETGSKPSMN